MHRSENLEKLESETFDLCIIGAGASGAGCALDAALRGMKVLLIDKTDFAAETSSRSTKMIHGGVRYLEQAFKNLDLAQLKQVRHGLEERHLVLKNAPHLTRPIGLITPVFSWWVGLYFYLGLRLYDLFAARKDNLPSSRWLSQKEALELMSGISTKIHSAVLYYDGQLDDSRYCLALVQSAAALGVSVINHIELIDFQKDRSGNIMGANVEDRIKSGKTFQIKAKLFLNCCGPYADNIRQLANPELAPRIRPSKGVHMILPLHYFESEQAMLIPKTKDGRVVFAIPFEGSLLVGTTDDPSSDLSQEPVLKSGEVDFLIETLQPYISKIIDSQDVKSGFGGLRPLVAARKNMNKKATKSLLRDHEVEYDSVSGLASLLGGKWTTYRLMAKDAIDFIAARLEVTKECQTATHLLHGATIVSSATVDTFAKSYQVDDDIAQHLVTKYGTKATLIGEIIKANIDLKERLVANYPFIQAEVVYTVKFEMALEIRDFMARRIRLEFLDWEAAKAATPAVAKLMASELSWPAADEKEKASSYIALLSSFESRVATI